MLLAYGVYSNINRGDNDYQVILVFDPEKFEEAAFDQNNPHLVGPAVYKKLFVYTGNTRYGVQNLEYDRETGDHWMVVYPGAKTSCLNYPMYLIDSKTAPVKQKLELGNSPDYGEMIGEVLALKKVGTYHAASDVWGIEERPDRADYGFISLGSDYFYVATGGKTEDGKQFGYVTLKKLDRTTYIFRAVE